MSSEREKGRAAIEGIAAGDQDAFLAFYRENSARFMKAVYYRVGCDMDVAEEIFQEAFRRMIKSRASLLKLKSDAELFPWLCGVARRITADHFRGKARRPTVLLESMDAAVREAVLRADSEPIDDELAAHEQMKMLVGMAMAALSPVHAEALKAKYCDGLSVNEMAEKFGVSTKVIEGRLYRGREAFRAAFLAVRRELEQNGGPGTLPVR